MKEIFGLLPDGKEVNLYTLTNKNGIEVKIANFGGLIHSIKTPDKDGNFEDILLGFKNLEGYLSAENPYFNCLIGRFGNRIANGKFSLNGKEYKLAANDDVNHLHGGLKGFDKVIWDAVEIKNGLELSYFSADGEEGYPGNLKVKVIYLLTDDNELVIRYFAETDAATPVNLTHHAYFNLTGNTKRDVLDHQVMIDALKYTEINDKLIPTGQNPLVEGTAFDFRKFKAIGKDIKSIGLGYDHNFVLEGSGLRKIAEAIEPQSKRKMEVYTTSIGVQFYTGNFLTEKVKGKKAGGYQKHDGFCLETQFFPDSPNIPSFPSCILQPGEQFKQETIYKFSIDK
jgi:aldose 1-epimerase